MSQASQTFEIKETEDFPVEGFYRPSEGLTNRICDRIDSLESEAVRSIEIREESDKQAGSDSASDSTRLESSDLSSEVMIQQRLIAEELDFCLADSAETIAANRGDKISIHRIITEGMSDALGLGNSDELLKELASEFQTWIDIEGSYTAGWGQIISANDGNIYLEAFRFEEEDAIPPDVTFTRSYDSGKSLKTPSTLGAKIAALAAKLGVG